MSYKSDCHYIEFQDKSVKGWLWRLELLPAIDTAFTDYYDGANNTFVPFRDDLILTENIGELETAYSDQPLGIASIPTLKLTFATDNMSSDEFETIVVNAGWDTSDDYQLHINNVWILRCDYGSGTISEESNIFFIGIQRAEGGVEEDIDIYGKSKCEITMVSALAELARIATIERFAHFVFYFYSAFYPTSVRIQGIVYQTIFNDKGNVTDCHDKDSGVWINTTYLNFFILLFIQTILRERFRLPGDMVKCIRFSHDHLSFFRQDTGSVTGETDGEIIEIDSMNYEDFTAPTQQELWLCCASLANDDTNLNNFEDLGMGLLVKSDYSGSYFEGETVADMLGNIAISWGAKQAYIIRNNKMVLTSGRLLADMNGGDGLSITLVESAIGGIKISTGAHGGLIRSATFNIDASGSEDDSEYKYQIAGNLSESDYSAKCVLHNLPRVREYNNDWHVRGTLITGGTYYVVNPDCEIPPFTAAEAQNLSWRAPGFDIRKIWYIDNFTNFSSGLTDHALVMRAHSYCWYNDGEDVRFLPDETYIMDNDHWGGTFLEMQRRGGLPNTLAKYVGLALSNKRRALVECTVGLDLITINDIGRLLNITFDGVLSRYAYLHDTGETYARAIILSVKSSIQNNTSEVQLLVLPKD